MSRIAFLCLQCHVRKAQALVSLGRTEEALREYLLCLSIEPDCKLAKAEAQRVNTAHANIYSAFICILLLFYRIIIQLFVVSSQLLSDLLAPVTDQVPEHISDYSNILSSRTHIKHRISSQAQVGDASIRHSPFSLRKSKTWGFIILTFFCLHLRPSVTVCRLLSALLLLRGQRNVNSQVRKSQTLGGWTTVLA